MTAAILKYALIYGNSCVTAKHIIEYMLANRDIKVPIKSTGTGYIDYITER